MKKFKFYIKLALLFIVPACGTSKIQQDLITTKVNQIQKSKSLKPKNIILMIGDGMGISQITAGMISNHNQLALERCTHVGIHKPFSADELIIDSAAGATAFSTGKKTKNAYLAMDPAGNSLPTILEDAKARGFSTGLVVTSTIVHATPAAFFAHQKSRDDYEDIALDLQKANVDLLIGGGKKYFDRRINDTINLIQKFLEQDYVVSDYFQQDYDQWVLPKAERLLYFTADGDPLTVSSGRSYLPKATKDAIQFLNQKKDNGFFLMVEGSQIDWGGHANNENYIITEMLDFDNAIKNALDFALEDQNTLVIITADHETGGFAINSGKMGGKLGTGFTTKNHSADLIPVFAFGPGAELFTGIYENTAIYYKMKQLLFK